MNIKETVENLGLTRQRANNKFSGICFTIFIDNTQSSRQTSSHIYITREQEKLHF